MRQLQFKFYALPTKLAGICIFHQRWIKTFNTQQFFQLCIKYVLVFNKIGLVQFCNKYMVGPSQKKLNSGTRKIKNVFLPKNSFLKTHLKRYLSYFLFVIFPGNLVTYNDTIRMFPNFLIFLNFLCPFQNAIKTAGLTVPS